MSKLDLSIVWGLAFLAASISAAQAPTPPGEPPKRAAAVDAEAARKQRLAFLSRTFATYSLAAPGRGEPPLDRSKEPVLRYSNPVRASFSDGAVFLWLADDRPLAAAAFSIRKAGRIGREFSSLATEPLICRGEAGEIWTPKSASLAEQTLSGVPSPAASEKLRTAQMRQLARRFRIVSREIESTSRTELRLLSQPVYRYSAEKAGVIDGALFAFVEANDPEALLLLEAVHGGGESPVWRYTLARFTSRPLEADWDDRRIWTVEGYWSQPRSRTDPYVEMASGVYPANP